MPALGASTSSKDNILALIGDSVDNLKGVDGLVGKGAAKLLAEHGSLNALLADPDALMIQPR